MRRVLPLALATAICTLALPAQTSPTADIQAEAERAQALYDQHKMFDALPLYEELHHLVPKSAVYTERLADCLMAIPENETAAQQKDRLTRARKLLLEAQPLGDNSQLVQVLLERTEGVDKLPTTAAALPPEGVELKKAEAAFSKGDMEGALAGYKAAFAINPKLYEAALFAGDAAFALHRNDEAGAWYQRAIEISPDRETAHRYWGDVLQKTNRPDKARQQFILALICEPYQKATRLGLKAWADANKMIYAAPPITIPSRAEPDAKGNMNITIDPNSLNSPTGSIWMVYPMSPAIWQKEKFHKTYPNETKYRDSLAEQVDALTLTLKVAHERKFDFSKDTTLRLLDELNAKGLLECWILLDHPDNGTWHDYAAYRANHRDQLIRYINEYDLKPLNR